MTSNDGSAPRLGKFITKSRYVGCSKCTKRAWMEFNGAERDEGVHDARRVRQGEQVGELARSYFGTHVLVRPEFSEDGSYDPIAMAAETAKLIATGTRNICEAAFVHGDEMCLCDIVNPVSDGEIDIAEVKSSSNGKKPASENIDDLAFQVHVAEACGYRVRNAMLMRVNGEFVRPPDGHIDPIEFFALEDLTEAVRERQPEVTENLDRIRIAASAPKAPECSISSACTCSKSPCPFKGGCWESQPGAELVSVSGIGPGTAVSWMEDGVSTLKQTMAMDGKPRLSKPKKKFHLNHRQRVQVSAAVTGTMEPHIDAAALKDFIAGLGYPESPVYFLDFESLMEPIPVFPGTKAYQQVPTQYSLHVLNPDGTVEHREFLADADGTNPMPAVAERLMEDIPADAMVIAYNMKFERDRLNELAKMYPEGSVEHGHLTAIRENLRDLLEPFAKGIVYFPAQGGSNSIKEVLPAVCSDDPDLDYKALDDVHNGTDAMDAFGLLLSGKLPEGEAAALKRNLLDYCKLDTLALVRVLQRLAEICDEADEIKAAA